MKRNFMGHKSNLHQKSINSLNYSPDDTKSADNWFFLPESIVFMAAILLVGCTSETINTEDAVRYAERATYIYLKRICNSSNVSINSFGVSIDAYIDSGKIYRVSQHVSIQGRPSFNVVVDVPQKKYDDETNAAVVGGEIFTCKEN